MAYSETYQNALEYLMWYIHHTWPKQFTSTNHTESLPLIFYIFVKAALTTYDAAWGPFY